MFVLICVLFFFAGRFFGNLLSRHNSAGPLFIDNAGPYLGITWIFVTLVIALTFGIAGIFPWLQIIIPTSVNALGMLFGYFHGLKNPPSLF